MTEKSSSDFSTMARAMMPYNFGGPLEIITTHLFKEKLTFQRLISLISKFMVLLALKSLFDSIPKWLGEHINLRSAITEINFGKILVVTSEKMNDEKMHFEKDVLERIKIELKDAHYINNFYCITAYYYFVSFQSNNVTFVPFTRTGFNNIRNWISEFEVETIDFATELKIIKEIDDEKTVFDAQARFRNVHETLQYSNFKGMISRYLRNAKLLDKSNCLALNFNGKPGTGKSAFIDYIGNCNLVTSLIKLYMIKFPENSLEKILVQINENSRPQESVIIIIDEPDKHLNLYIQYRIDEIKKDYETKLKREYKMSLRQKEELAVRIRQNNLSFYQKLIDGDILTKFNQVVLIFISNHWEQMFDGVHKDYDAVKDRVTTITFRPLDKDGVLEFLDKTYERLDEVYDRDLFVQKIPNDIEISCRCLDMILIVSSYEPTKVLEKLTNDDPMKLSSISLSKNDETIEIDEDENLDILENCFENLTRIEIERCDCCKNSECQASINGKCHCFDEESENESYFDEEIVDERECEEIVDEREYEEIVDDMVDEREHNDEIESHKNSIKTDRKKNFVIVESSNGVNNYKTHEFENFDKNQIYDYFMRKSMKFKSETNHKKIFLDSDVKSDIVTTIKEFLNDTEIAIGKETKMKMVIKLYKYMLSHDQILPFLYHNPQFALVVWNKCKEHLTETGDDEIYLSFVKTVTQMKKFVEGVFYFDRAIYRKYL